MSNVNINEEKGSGVINDVVFAYIKLQSGDYKYKSNTEKEYSVDAIVDKATAKAFKKAFPKNGYKEIDTEDFEEKFKIAPPFPDEDEQFVIKFKADAQVSIDFPKHGLSEGDDVPYEWSTRPKVFLPTDGGVKDITMETLVANGSKGKVAFNIKTNDFGTFPKFTGILVEDLIEYQSEGGDNNPFGEVVGGLNPGKGKPQQVPTEKPQEDPSEASEEDKPKSKGVAKGKDKKAPVEQPEDSEPPFDEDNDAPF